MKTINAETINFISNYVEDKKFQQLTYLSGHGTTSLIDHSISVALLSSRIATKLKAKIDWTDLLTGALLHDYYLYDWKQEKVWKLNIFKMHGWTHSTTALANAEKDFDLSDKAKNIILSHMWPLTITKLPKSKEAWIVSIADKICATKETFRNIRH